YRTSLTRNFNSTTYTDSEIPEVNSRDRRRSTLWAGKLYLSFPLLRGKFTAGTQDSYTHTSLDYKMLNPEVGQYIPSTLTDARQTFLAAFASWDRNFGRLSLSAGLRFEHIAYTFKTDGVRDDNLSRTDNLLTPDLSLGWTFSEDAQANLSYRMSRIKPPYSQLTGGLAYTGRHEIEGGNPALKDECMHDIQLFGMWKNFILQADFTRSLDTYAYVKRLYPAETLQLLMQPVNIDVSAVDLYLVWSKNIKAWTPNVTLGMHKQWLHLGSTRYNRPIFSLYFENMISLPAGFLLSVNANAQTKGDMHTNRFGATWFVMDASVSKSFLNKSLQLRLSATDIFNTMSNDWSMDTYGVRVDKRQSYDRRGVSLSISYRLNPRQSKYKGQNASESELN
ncbi:MAG: outer membrane beta-barrel family protein, partial [Duncaniella sp.]|nr:outer membrane beta-barrel family protein [Duncaniella sp.]